MTKSQLLAEMDVAMGGRVAEELMFGPDKVTTGTLSFLYLVNYASKICAATSYKVINIRVYDYTVVYKNIIKFIVYLVHDHCDQHL